MLITLPPTVDPIILLNEPLVIVPALVLVLYGLVRLTQALRAWQARRPSVVADAVATWLISVIDAAFQGAIHQLDEYPPEQRSQRLDELAHQLYAFLPAFFTVTVRGRPVLIPFKWLVSEDQFVQFVRGVASEVDFLIDGFREHLEEEYRQYRADPDAVSRAAYFAGQRAPAIR